MEITKNNLEIEHSNLTKANYIYYNLNYKSERNKYGFVLTEIKLNNGKRYCIVIESNSTDKNFNITNYSISNLSNLNQSSDIETIKEFFINKNDELIKFKNEAYFRVINIEDGNETKYVFTDYNDALEYLEMLDDQSSSNKSSPL